MRVWISVVCGLLAACEATEEPSGTGPSEGTPSTSTRPPTSSSRFDGSGGIAGGEPQGCLDGCAALFAPGVGLYESIAACVYCDVCGASCRGGGYLVCSGGTPTAFCTDSDCDACADCALERVCAEALDECKRSDDCVAYGNCIADC